EIGVRSRTKPAERKVIYYHQQGNTDRMTSPATTPGVREELGGTFRKPSAGQRGGDAGAGPASGRRPNSETGGERRPPNRPGRPACQGKPLRAQPPSRGVRK